jgi:hypothetical protein
MAEFIGAATPISEAGLERATQLVGAGSAEIWTVLAVETKGFGYLPDRRPAILFERHIFCKQTGGRYNGSNPLISSPTSGGYLGGAREYDRLAEATALDRHTALGSASWGIGQVLGINYIATGYPSVEAMVQAMVASEDNQLAAMASFVRSTGLHRALAGHDWAAFARGYNGPNFARNQYDTLLAQHYQRFATGPLPNIRIRQAQALLTFLGVDPYGIDGVAGRRTQDAINQFRLANGLGDSSEIDDELIAALTAKVAAIN